MSKQTTIRTDAQLRQAIKESLEQDNRLRWHWRAAGPTKEAGTRTLLELDVDGRQVLFQVEFKLSPSVKEVGQLAARKDLKHGLLIAPSLSEVLVNHCRERGLSCLDLNGRQWIRADGIVVDRQAAVSKRFRPFLKPPGVFQPKSSRLVRALLSQPDRAWSQSELKSRTGLSPGLISRLVRHLANEGLLEQEGRLLNIARADLLLDAWAAKDDWAARTTVRQYSLLESDIETVARRLVRVFPPDEELVFTQWFAANLRHPYTVPPVASAYVGDFPTAEIERSLGARHVDSGGTLWLVVPNDDGVFRETQKVGEFTLACDAQIYLDLLDSGLRGSEQAKALREWAGFATTKT